MDSRLQAVPRYVQVARELGHRIEAGEFPPGSQMPTESALCREYGVSRYTVREALRRLQDMGIIRRRRGSGTLVETPGGPRRLHQRLTNIDDLTQFATGTRFTYSYQGARVTDARLAALLDGRVEQTWLLVSGVRASPALDRPLCVTDVYFAPQVKAFIDRLRPTADPFFKQIEALGGPAACAVEQELFAIAASKEDARALMIEQHAPCLRIVRRYRAAGANAGVHLVSINTHPGDIFSYAMQMEG